MHHQDHVESACFVLGIVCTRGMLCSFPTQLCRDIGDAVNGEPSLQQACNKGSLDKSLPFSELQFPSQEWLCERVMQTLKHSQG